MKSSKWLALALVSTAVSLAGCSDAPPASIVISAGTPPSGDPASGAGGTPLDPTPAPPISFMPATDAAAPVAPSGMAPAGASDAGSVSSAEAGATATASGVPCDVATYFAAKCTSCHGNPPLPSALTGLVTLSDMKAISKEDPTKNEAELSLARMKNAASPMPPGALPSASEVAVLDNWIKAGYPPGSCVSADGGVIAPPPPPPAPTSVFKDAPAFTARNGSNSHNAGRDCMGCHKNGGGDAPRFSFGGTLYDGAGKAVGGAEVRLVDANGKASSVYTGTNGTFYQSGSGFTGPAQIGVRNGTAVQDMITALQSSNGGACSSCHCSGGNCTTPVIHLP